MDKPVATGQERESLYRETFHQQMEGKKLSFLTNILIFVTMRRVILTSFLFSILFCGVFPTARQFVLIFEARHFDEFFVNNI